MLRLAVGGIGDVPRARGLGDYGLDLAQLA